jgi:hypothetical protein
MAMMGQPEGQDAIFQRFDTLSEDDVATLEAYAAHVRDSKLGSSSLDAARAFMAPGHVLYLERRRPHGAGKPPLCCGCVDALTCACLCPSRNDPGSEVHCRCAHGAVGPAGQQ